MYERRYIIFFFTSLHAVQNKCFLTSFFYMLKFLKAFMEFHPIILGWAENINI